MFLNVSFTGWYGDDRGGDDRDGGDRDGDDRDGVLVIDIHWYWSRDHKSVFLYFVW